MICSPCCLPLVWRCQALIISSVTASSSWHDIPWLLTPRQVLHRNKEKGDSATKPGGGTAMCRQCCGGKISGSS